MAGHGGDTGGRFSDDFQPKNQKVSAARITDRTSWLSDSNDPRKRNNTGFNIVIGDWHYNDRSLTLEKAGLT